MENRKRHAKKSKKRSAEKKRIKARKREAEGRRRRAALIFSSDNSQDAGQQTFTTIPATVQGPRYFEAISKNSPAPGLYAFSTPLTGTQALEFEQQQRPEPVAGPSSAPDIPIIESEESSTDSELEEIIRELHSAPTLGKAINKIIASSLKEILTNGLDETTKRKMMDQYEVPKNCQLLNAPLLNAKIRAVLDQTLLDLDAFISQTQIQTAKAVVALMEASDMLSQRNLSRRKIFKPIIDATHLMCDNLYRGTIRRRNSLVPSAASDRNAFMAKLRDNLLFREIDEDTLEEDPEPKTPRFIRRYFNKDVIVVPPQGARRSPSRSLSNSPPRPVVVRPTIVLSAQRIEVPFTGLFKPSKQKNGVISNRVNLCINVFLSVATRKRID